MITSFKKNKYGILLMIFASVLVCLGQAAWKLLPVYGILTVLLGGVLYAMGALCMLVALRYGSLSIVQPMISFSYVLALPIGRVIFGEDIELSRLIGILIILTGLFLICGGDDC